MTEDEAKDWLTATFNVSRETMSKIERYIALLIEGMAHQNLIAESTVPNMWSRHIVDSAQLISFAGKAGHGPWFDLGSGAGLPAIVVAILTDREVVMIESRRKRIDFLNHVVTELGLANATVIGGRVETAESFQAAVISARAYAPLDKLLSSAEHLSGSKTWWVLPKGRNAQNELDAARRSWQGVFHVEPSVTDPDSAIIVAKSVKRIGRKSAS